MVSAADWIAGTTSPSSLRITAAAPLPAPEARLPGSPRNEPHLVGPRQMHQRAQVVARCGDAHRLRHDPINPRAFGVRGAGPEVGAEHPSNGWRREHRPKVTR